jgi:hypothetical protein
LDRDFEGGFRTIVLFFAVEQHPLNPHFSYEDAGFCFIDGGGLYLEITKAGGRYWQLK